MTLPGNPNANNVAGVQGYDDTNHQVVNIRAKNITTDSSVTPNVVTGDLGVDVEVSVNPPQDQTATGAITTDQGAVTITLNSGMETATIQITTANLNGTVLFEYLAPDNATWNSLPSYPVSGGNSVTSVVGSGGSQAVGTWKANISGFMGVRARLHPTTSGTATVYLRASTAPFVQSVVVLNGNTNGSATSVNSSPVVIASDQVAIPVKRTIVSLFSTTQTAQGSGNSGDLTVGPYTAIGIDVNITANVQGSNPTIQFFWERKGIADGIYYVLWQSDLIQALPANPTPVSTSIGHGMEFPQHLGATGRLRWVVGGTATPQYTFTPNVQAS